MIGINHTTYLSNALNRLKALIPIVITAALIWLLYQTVSLFVRAILASPAAIQAAVIAGAATIFVSVFSLIWSNKVQKQREIETEHRKQKAEIYEEFMKFWFDFFLRDKTGKEPATEQEMIEFVASFSQKIIVWGSDDILREYLAWRSMVREPDAVSAKAMMARLESLIFAMRRDLGHSNKGLPETSLLRLFINDLDEVWDEDSGALCVVNDTKLTSSNV